MSAPAPSVRTAPSPPDRAALFVLSFFGLGFGPLVPGTFGTLGGVLVALAIPEEHWTAGIAAAVFLSSLLTVLLGPAACRAAGRKDPPAVVMDEVAGFLVVVALVPAPTPVEMAAAFALFRVFDILKPPPARRLEGLPGGWGILLDDLAAGLFALAALWALGAVIPLR